MKNLQELWSKLLFCPLCQDITRKITMSGGPADALHLLSFKKINHILKLHCEFAAFNNVYDIKYDINCLDNSISCNISSPQFVAEEQKKAKSPFFYFGIHADCRQCTNSYADSKDIEIDLLNHKITNIGLEREGVWLLDQNPQYHITLFHPEEQMLISRCHEDENGGIVDDTDPSIFPIIQFDFSKPKKVANKIQTLLLFS